LARITRINKISENPCESVADVLEIKILDFQINDDTYFADLGEGGWQVFVETPSGARPVPVYDDGADAEDSPVLVEDKRGRKIVN